MKKKLFQTVLSILLVVVFLMSQACTAKNDQNSDTTESGQTGSDTTVADNSENAVTTAAETTDVQATVPGTTEAGTAGTTDSETVTEAPDTTDAETTGEPDPRTDLSVYTIVADAKSTETANNLAKALKTISGKELTVTGTDGVRTEHEILVGNTGDEIVTETVSGYKTYDYIICEKGTKIILAGGSADATASAVRRFLATYFGYTDEKHFTPVDSLRIEISDRRDILPGGKYLTNFDKTDLSSYPYYDSLVSPVVGEDYYDGAVGANAIYKLFSGVQGTQSLVYQFGNEACYFEWVADKIMSTGDKSYINTLKSKIQEYPQNRYRIYVVVVEFCLLAVR